MKYTLPNLLSLSRIVFLPIILLIIYSDLKWVFIITFILYQATDVLDGYFARKLNQTSEIGAKLDAIGDMCSYIIAYFFLLKFYPHFFSTNNYYLIISYAMIIAMRIVISKIAINEWISTINFWEQTLKFWIQTLFIILLFFNLKNQLFFYITFLIGIYTEIKLMINVIKFKNRLKISKL